MRERKSSRSTRMYKFIIRYTYTEFFFLELRYESLLSKIN